MAISREVRSPDPERGRAVVRMKRAELVRKLEEGGCILIRHGGNHDWYRNSRTGVAQPVPGHREINEFLARHIPKKLAN